MEQILTSLKVLILGMLIAFTSLFWKANLDAMVYHLLVGIVIMIIALILQQKEHKSNKNN